MTKSSDLAHLSAHIVPPFRVRLDRHRSGCSFEDHDYEGPHVGADRADALSLVNSFERGVDGLEILVGDSLGHGEAEVVASAQEDDVHFMVAVHDTLSAEVRSAFWVALVVAVV